MCCFEQIGTSAIEMSVDAIIRSNLANLECDILEYVISVVEGMTENERKNHMILIEVIAPFLVDSGFSDETGSEDICKKLAVVFGGSGYCKSTLSLPEEEAPTLLSAPIRMIETSGLQPVKATYGGAIIADTIGDIEQGVAVFSQLGHSVGSTPSHNANLDIKSVATGAKDLRRQRKESEKLSRILQAEAAAEAERRKEFAAARMAAIRASRTAGRQSTVGVNIDLFSLPHPTGTGDLLTDASLVLVPGRRYGLIGRNGAGKSTLLRSLANYKLPGLSHLRILVVDQHVEGDKDTALEWLLRADVERTSLLEDEARLSSYLHGSVEGPLPDDLKAVNLEVALTECYERMEAIGVGTAEQRAQSILVGLGFGEEMISRPTNSLSGGWAMRAALGAAIFVKPNLLLLDEPTNHLDLHALVWLERWLLDGYNGIAVIVSHDQFFLNEVLF